MARKAGFAAAAATRGSDITNRDHEGERETSDHRGTRVCCRQSDPRS
jgi:hypothetical protein